MAGKDDLAEAMWLLEELPMSQRLENMMGREWLKRYFAFMARSKAA